MKFSAATVLASLAGAMAAPGQQVQALDRRSGGGVCQGQFKNAVCCSEAATISGTLAIGLECESAPGTPTNATQFASECKKEKKTHALCCVLRVGTVAALPCEPVTQA
ncbi:hypothetical protein PCL_03980 [Purpureocillium lilacinum]|uniref:Fungal hydrophobin n=1 Tax=Purpureocillium lilacinum TaxID=33203 RepID=A0A2U3EQK2_PURLI|nr:fungal hydrophobin [Purpureocillium lilacinum]PWI76786.1 hypothetical protein PCL_03980 [Purpureocillium lilacinum]